MKYVLFLFNKILNLEVDYHFFSLFPIYNYRLYFQEKLEFGGKSHRSIRNIVIVHSIFQINNMLSKK